MKKLIVGNRIANLKRRFNATTSFSIIKCSKCGGRDLMLKKEVFKCRQCGAIFPIKKQKVKVNINVN